MDGKARVLIPQTVFEELLSFVPSWHACVVGPVPFGQIERFRYSITGILRPNREEAAEACANHAKALCAQFSHVYDEDEWEIVHLVLSTNSS